MFFQEEDKVQVLTYGTGVSLVGIVLALIMNCINKREHDRWGQEKRLV